MPSSWSSRRSLLDQLSRALAYPRIRERVSASEANGFLELLRRAAQMLDDPKGPAPIASEDAGDDYLIALALGSSAYLVSGDRHLTTLEGQAPILAPRSFSALTEPA